MVSSSEFLDDQSTLWLNLGVTDSKPYVRSYLQIYLISDMVSLVASAGFLFGYLESKYSPRVLRAQFCLERFKSQLSPDLSGIPTQTCWLFFTRAVLSWGTCRPLEAHFVEVNFVVVGKQIPASILHSPRLLSSCKDCLQHARKLNLQIFMLTLFWSEIFW